MVAQLFIVSQSFAGILSAEKPLARKCLPSRRRRRKVYRAKTSRRGWCNYDVIFNDDNDNNRERIARAKRVVSARESHVSGLARGAYAFLHVVRRK